MVVFSAPPAPAERAASPGALRVKVVGLGAGGIHFVNAMVVEDVAGCDFFGLDSDADSLAVSLAGRNLLVGPRACAGQGTDCEPLQGRRAAEESRDEIARLLQGAQLVVLVGGLGGGLASGAATPVARIARQAGAGLVIGLFTLPHRREGQVRRKYAEMALPMLERALDTTILYPNDRLARDPSQRPLALSADRSAETIAAAFQGVIDLMQRCGRIRVDFADVRAGLAARGYGSLSAATATGLDRACRAVRGALESPLQEVGLLARAESVFVQMRVGTDLPMKDVSRALGLITRACGEGKRVDLALSQEKRLDGLARCTVLAACARQAEARAPAFAAA